MQFENTETYKNLARSFAGECQAGMRYQMIAKLAMQEKMKTLADTIKAIAKNETLHATQFFNKMIEKTGSKEALGYIKLTASENCVKAILWLGKRALQKARRSAEKEQGNCQGHEHPRPLDRCHIQRGHRTCPAGFQGNDCSRFLQGKALVNEIR